MHNYCLLGDPSSKVKSFARDGMSSIDLFEGIENPLGNAGHGLIHILERHSPDFFPAHAKETLFRSGTTIDQITDGIEEVFARGVRQTPPNQVMQRFEKRIKINEESANYRLIVDTANKYVVTFFKIGS